MKRASTPAAVREVLPVAVWLPALAAVSPVLVQALLMTLASAQVPGKVLR